MLDKKFKKLFHNGNQYDIIHRGSEIMPGYKPDVVLKKGDYNYILLESEHGTSRKHFLGGMLKAAKFLTGNKFGKLIFVIKTKDNTTVENISKHLYPYLVWISGLTNLNEVYVIEDNVYCNTGKRPLLIFGKDFLKFSKKVIGS